MIYVTVTMMRSLFTLVEYQAEQFVEFEEGADITSLFKKFTDIYGGRLKDALFDKNMNIRDDISIYLNGVPFRSIRGLNAKLMNRDSIIVYPPVLGNKNSSIETI